MNKKLKVSVLKQIIVFFLIIITIGISTSCKSRKHIVEIEEKPSEALLLVNELNSGQLPFNSLLIKFSGKLLNGDSKISVKGTIKIQKDSIIWISVSPGFGIELARLVLSRDSVKIIDKLNSTYYVGDYDYFNRKYQVQIDYFALQSILLNKYFQYNDSKNEIIYKDLISEDIDKSIVCIKIPIDKNNQILSSVDGAKILEKIFINKQTKKILKFSLEDNFEHKKMEIEYAEFQKVNKLLFPKEINLNIETISNSMNFALKYSKVVVDKKMKYPFKVSKKYKRISY